MKRIIAVIAVMALSSVSHARFGIGAVLGDPTGLSFESEVDSQHSWDGVIAWSSGKNAGFHIHGDYLITRGAIADLDGHPLELFYGIGGRMIQIDNDNSDDDGKTSLGVRAPVGLQVKIQDPNIEFFGEIAPVLDLVPSTGLDFDVGIGGRYYF